MAIRVLRNAVGGGGCQLSRKKSVTKVYGSTLLLALRGITVTSGWVGVKFPGKKRYVTLEWPLSGGPEGSNLSKSRGGGGKCATELNRGVYRQQSTPHKSWTKIKRNSF